MKFAPAVLFCCMAISQRTDHQSLPMDTSAGTVSVDVQNGRTVYVRAALGERGQHPDAAEPLDAGRGALVDFRGHFRLHDDDCWKPVPGFISVHRVDQKRGKDPTPAMVNRVVDAIAEMLRAHMGSASSWAAPLRVLLLEAERDAATQEAQSRLEIARELRAVADHLAAEAAELLQGGRVTHRRLKFHDRGADYRATQVERADGTLMDPPRQPPTVYGSLDFPLTNVKSNEETD